MDNYQKQVWTDLDECMPEYVEFGHKNILITGACGMIGAYLVYMFLHQNRKYNANLRVFALMRNSDAAQKKFSDVWEQGDFYPLIQDVVDDVEMNVRFDYIVHAASPGNSEKFYDAIVQANVLGTQRLLERCHRDDAAFLYISSGAIYGSSITNKRISESDVIDSTIALNDSKKIYGIAKRAGELLCEAYAQKYHMNIKIVRVFSVFGPGGALNSGRHFTDFLRCILEHRKIEMTGDGRAVRSYCYVADAVRGFMDILLKGERAVYNLGSARNIYSIRGFYDICCSYIEHSFEDVSGMTSMGDGDYFVANIDELEELGWKESYNIYNIIDCCLKSY